MELIPALDLLNGKAVRLLNGKADCQFDYAIDPVSWAKKWTALGAKRLHIVNLSAAFKGGLSDEDLHLLKQLREATPITLEYGGGLRSAALARSVLDMGYDVVLGSLLMTCLQEACDLRKDFGSRVIAGIDALDGQVATHGWTQQSTLTAETLCRLLLEKDFHDFIFTDIAKDGTLGAPNYAALKAIKNLGTFRLTASGGVGSLLDLTDLRKAGMDGAIVGKALLDGLLDPQAALEVCHA